MVVDVKFQGRRTFSGPVPNSRELNEFAGDVVRHLESLQERRTWTWLDIARADTSLVFDCMRPIDTSAGGTVNVILPPQTERRTGRELALLRTSASGTIVLRPSIGCTVNAASSLTLAAAVGYFVLTYDGGTGFYVQRGP